MTISLLCLPLFFCGSPQEPAKAAAQSAAQAAAWLEKAAANSGKPVELDVRVEIAGQMPTTMTGHFFMADDKHYRGNARYETDLAAVNGTKMSVEMALVADGTSLWVDTTHPEAGRRVLKQSLEELAKMQAQSGAARGLAASAPGAGSFDFAEQVKLFASLADLQLVSIENGRVRLEGPVSAAGNDAFTAMVPVAPERITLVLDEKTAYPVEIVVIGEGKPIVRTVLSNVRFPEKVDPGQFSFTPPEGVPVQEVRAPAPRGGG